MPNLTLVVCGAPLAARAKDVAEALEATGWQVTILTTAAAKSWTGLGASEFRDPSTSKPPRPDAVVVCPMTFNTANKGALGIADTQPLSLLSEALGLDIPIVAVPFVGTALWHHPAWTVSLQRLRAGGVQLLDPRADLLELAPLASGNGDKVARDFRPARLLAMLESANKLTRSAHSG
ncbi:MAG: flavoprotein [Nocardioides sp.]